MRTLAAMLALAATPDGELAREVRDRGWIVFGARSPKGDWDLFLMRPDGSDLRNLTRTPEWNEGLPRFSPDGKRLLYRRIPAGETFDNNRHGMQGELVLANADASGPEVFGGPGEYPWASWSPDGRHLACLSPQGIRIVEVATKRTMATLDRRGFFQQMIWSPDGRWFAGVANNFGTGWSVARMDAASGAVNAVSCVDCCTPDWFPDSRRIVFSRRPGEWTQLWMADGEGKDRVLLYAEDGRHCYGGCVSPGGEYLLFTGNKEEDGDPKNAGAPMTLMRLRDAPIVKGAVKGLPRPLPGAREGPLLILPAGWEPHWTAASVGGRR